VGQRVLTSVAKKTAGLFFSAIDDVITGKKPVGAGAVAAAVPHTGTHEPAGATGAAGAGAAAGAPVAAAPAFGATLAPAGGAAAGPFGGLGTLGAVLVGAAAALIGVLIGARIARRR
jgi:hypothetical protein